MTTPHTTIRYTAVLLLSITIFATAGCKRNDEAPKAEVIRPAKMMTVSTVNDSLSREFPGEVRASQRVDLAFQVSGPLTEFPVEEGKSIKKGGLIAQILPRDYQTTLNAARADAQAAEQNYNRFKQLYIRKQISKAEFDGAKRAYDVAKSQVERSSNALKDTRLIAPFPGVIAKKYVDNFQEVTAKQPIVSLQDVSDLEVLVNLPEVFMSKLRDKTIGEIVAFASFPADPKQKFPLSLKKYETQADPQTRTYQVVLAMAAPKTISILPGMTATVTGKTTPEEMSDISVFMVPVEAVFAENSGKQYVWVVSPDTMVVKKREITTAAVSGRSIQVLTGLENGEKIVIAGVHFIQPGMKVREIKTTAGGKS